MIGLRELALLGGGRAGALWSLGRAQEPPGPDDLALDFSHAARAEAVGGPRAPGSSRRQSTMPTTAAAPTWARARPFLLGETGCTGS